MKRIRILVVVALLLFTSAGVVTAQDWSQYQKNPENTGSSDGEDRQSWEYVTNTSITSPVVKSDGIVYFGDSQGQVYAVNEETQDVLWSSSLGSELIHASPVIKGNSVYFTDGSGVVYSFNLSGGKNWEFETDRVTLSTPAVVGDTVFAADAKSVYAVDAESGQEVWKTEVDEVIAFSPTVDGSLYVGTIESRRPEGQGANGTLYSISLEDGSVNWRVSGSGVVTTPAVTDSTVIFGTVNGSLLAVERESGDEAWSVSTKTSEVSSPAYKDGSIYYGVASDKLYAVEAENGEQEWVFEGSGDMTVSPAVSGEMVYTGSRSGFVYAVNASTGEGVWWTELGSGITNIALTSVGDTAYAGGEVGVYAVSRNSAEATRYGGDEEGENGDGVDLPPPGEEDPLVEPPTEYANESDNETEPNVSDGPETPKESDRKDGGGPASYLYPLAAGMVALVIIALYGWRKDLY